MKKILGWLHLWLGIASGLVVLVVALSGSLLVFEDELELLFNPSFHYVKAAPGAQPLPASELTARVLDHYKGSRLRGIEIRPEADRTTLFHVYRQKKQVLIAAVDPYTGRIIRDVPEERRFFRVVLQLHRYLCMGQAGKVITGISCSIFLVLILTGLVLWWPKRNNRKQRLRVKWNASWKRLNWDLHAVLGFYVHIVLFMIALTGLVWSYKWVNNLIFYVFDGKPQQKREAPAVARAGAYGTAYLDKALAATHSILTYRGPVIVRFPDKDGLAVTISKLNTEASISNVVSFLYFQPGTGRLVQKRLYETESRGMKARRIVYPIHTGSLYGWPTKLLALVCSLVAASLPVTGFCVWLNRKRKKQPARPAKNKSKEAAPLPKDAVSFPVT